jgi:hypothetical protein
MNNQNKKQGAPGTNRNSDDMSNVGGRDPDRQSQTGSGQSNNPSPQRSDQPRESQRPERGDERRR